MIDILREQDPTHSVEKAEDSDKPTVVIDAGIATIVRVRIKRRKRNPYKVG